MNKDQEKLSEERAGDPYFPFPVQIQEKPNVSRSHILFVYVGMCGTFLMLGWNSLPRITDDARCFSSFVLAFAVNGVMRCVLERETVSRILICSAVVAVWSYSVSDWVKFAQSSEPLALVARVVAFTGVLAIPIETFLFHVLIASYSNKK